MNNILQFVPGKERRQKFYAVIPVKMSISGTFMQINKFFYSVGRLKRIVNIRNLRLGNPKVTNKGVKLRALFQASTFRFLQPGEKGKKGKGKRKGRRG